MPVIFRYRGFRFYFYSNEGSPREPPHIHVRQGRDEAKIWRSPEARIAHNEGFDARTLAELLRLTEDHSAEFEGAWHEYFS